MEKLFPISINPNLCVRCQKCSYSCPPKAIFFRNSLRYVDYNKCEGCLKCVEVCEHGAIEVMSFEGKTLIGFKIDNDRCELCKKCIEPNFCLQNLFKIEKDENGDEKIMFNPSDLQICEKCLKCVISCPFNAILPLMDEK
ncbi:MAG: 4Fe-4S binding protein [Promethearchaeia archaeon]